MITYEEAKGKITRQKRSKGPYWNTIVAMVLAEVAEGHGKEKANQLIRECGLKRLGWKEEPCSEAGRN